MGSPISPKAVAQDIDSTGVSPDTPLTSHFEGLQSPSIVLQEILAQEVATLALKEELAVIKSDIKKLKKLIDVEVRILSSEDPEIQTLADIDALNLKLKELYELSVIKVRLAKELKIVL
jgi:hypothetical protein